MDIFKKLWARLKTPQYRNATIVIAIMAVITLWSHINSVDPVVDTEREEAIRTYEVHKARSESAHANIKAIDAALAALDEKSLYWATMRAKKITNTTARVRMETFIALTGIWWERRDAVLDKHWSPEGGQPDFRECWDHILACYKDMQVAEEGLHSQYFYEESLLGRYRTYGVESILQGYKQVIADDYYDKQDICDRTLEAEKRAAYPEAWEAEQAARALEIEREEEVKAQRDDLEAFDAAYENASEVDKTLLVLTETAKEMALWWGITTLSIGAFYLFVWWLVSLDGWAKVVAFHNGEIAGVILVRYPFLRLALSGACHKNWRIKKDFWGRAVLCDRMGNRVVVTENTPSSVVAMLFSESLHAHTAFGNEHSDALAVMVREKDAKLEYSDHTVGYYRDEQRKLNIAVAKRNRLLVLAVEAMRKSTEFQRSKVILAIRENLLAKMKKELADDADLWKALKEREEEEGLSEQATQ